MIFVPATPPLAPRPAGPGLRLDSGLWLDTSAAHERIDQLLRGGAVTGDQAALLRGFERDGYARFHSGIDGGLLELCVSDVDRLWRERPADLAYAWDGPARPMALADPPRERTVRVRIHDLHSHSPAARALYLDPGIHRQMALLFGAEVVAVQSLYFEFGSEQTLHRDPVVVPTDGHGHLMAAWIALEDIDEDAGALVYVPGSHRLPYFEFAPGEYRFDGRTMAHRVDEAINFDEQQCAGAGLRPHAFTARRGEVLIWHAGLRHGGSPVRRAGATRRSFVVHFSSRATYRTRAITVVDRVAGADGALIDRPRVMETAELLAGEGTVGYQNPMLGRERAG